MFDTDTPNIGKDLMYIHTVITRGLYVALGYSQSSALSLHTNEAKRRGFITYMKSLISVMNGHHQLEDQIMYPYLKYRMPEVPFDMLKSQHQDMMNGLDNVVKTIEEQTSWSFGDSLGVLNRELNDIKKIWHSHIQVEEKYFTDDRINAVIGYREQKMLSKIFNEYIREYSGPDYMVVPFIIYNLPPEERAVFSKKIPPALAQQVTSDGWKEKWMPMSTFMLL
jgi:hemerythrin-like domain-containing protein